MPQNLYNLPKGWEWRAIKDVVEKTANLTPASEPNLKWTYVDISSIDRKTHQITEPKLIAGKNVPSRAKKHIQKNDILFATTRPPRRPQSLPPQCRLPGRIVGTGHV